MKLLDVDVTKRYSSRQALDHLIEICPKTFSGFLIQINSLFTSTNYGKPDRKIGLIAFHWNKLWPLFFGIDKKVPKVEYSLNFRLINKLLRDKIIERYENADFELLFSQEVPYSTDNVESAKLLLTLILKNMNFTKFIQTQIVAIDLIYLLSTQLDSLYVIQTVLPYLLRLLKSSNIRVKLVAFENCLRILESITQLSLPPTDFNFFLSYTLQKMEELFKSSETTANLAFVKNLNRITAINATFLSLEVTSKSEYLLLNSSSKKKNQEMEIMKAYDDRDNLFNCRVIDDYVNNLIAKSETDNNFLIVFNQITPKLIKLLNIKTCESYVKYLFSQFNKKEWRILVEMLNIIHLVAFNLGDGVIGENILTYLMFKVQSIKTHKEIQIMAIVDCVLNMYRCQALDEDTILEMITYLYDFLVHPNYQIRSKTKTLLLEITKELDQATIFTYIRKDLLNFIQIPFLKFQSKILEDGLRDPLPRLAYLLKYKEINHNVSFEEADLQMLMRFNEPERMVEMRFSEEALNLNQLSQIVSKIPVAKMTHLLRDKITFEFIKEMGREDKDKLKPYMWNKIIKIAQQVELFEMPSPFSTLNVADKIEPKELFRSDEFFFFQLFKVFSVKLKSSYMESIVLI